MTILNPPQPGDSRNVRPLDLSSLTKLRTSPRLLRAIQKAVQSVITPQYALMTLYSRVKLNIRWKLQPEQKLCVEIFDTLSALLIEGKLTAAFLHIGNEGKRHKIVGAIMRRMGMIPGAYDYIFFKRGFAGFIEIKIPEERGISEKTGKEIITRQGGKENDNQELFGMMLDSFGVSRAICRSTDEVLETLKGWGVLCL